MTAQKHLRELEKIVEDHPAGNEFLEAALSPMPPLVEV